MSLPIKSMSNPTFQEPGLNIIIIISINKNSVHHFCIPSKMATNMKSLVFISVLLVAGGKAYSRRIGEDLKLWVSSDTCEPPYGYLPCSTNIWGLLFLIVAYDILLRYGSGYVAKGSEIFFELIGPGIVGSSLFQFLSTIPQIVLLLVSSLSDSNEKAQERAKFGVGLIAGTTAMLLTLVWGLSVVFGSYDFARVLPVENYGLQKTPEEGYGVVTDVETCYTARIMLISLTPFFLVLVAKAFDFIGGKRWIYLIALIITFILLFGYIVAQVFNPWIQNRRFESLMSKYAKDKVLSLLSSNGLPDSAKIHWMFSKIDKNKNSFLCASELRGFLFGLGIADEDLDTERNIDITLDSLDALRNIEIILKSFDNNEDGQVSKEEFVEKISELVYALSDQHPNRITFGRVKNTQNNSPLQQKLLQNETITNKGPAHSWLDRWLKYCKAVFYVALGTAMLCALSSPLVGTTLEFAKVANLSSFTVSYLIVPLSVNYRGALQFVHSSQERTQKSISLTLSALYGGVFMNNVIGMILYLAPVFALDLDADVFMQVLVVVIICTGMTLVASFRTTFYRWMGFLIVSLYPISLALIYLVTSHLEA